MVCYLEGAFYPKWVCGAGMCGDGAYQSGPTREIARSMALGTTPYLGKFETWQVLKNDFKGIDMLEKWLLRLDSCRARRATASRAKPGNSLGCQLVASWLLRLDSNQQPSG